MTTAIPHTQHIFGLSYVSSLRQDYKHLSEAKHHFPEPSLNIRFSLKAIANTYLTRRSMKAEGPLTHKKSSSRSAGQAPSPHKIAVNTVSAFGCAYPFSPANKAIRFRLRLRPASRVPVLTAAGVMDESSKGSQYIQTYLSSSSPRAWLTVSSRTSSSSATSGAHRHATGPVTSSTMRRGYRGSPEPAGDSDSSQLTSGDENTSDFSSRATSPETDIPHHETMLERKKRKIVDSGMDIFLIELSKWFIQEFGIVSHAGGGRGTKRSRDSFGSTSSSSSSPLNGAQKRGFDEDGYHDAGGDEEGGDKGDGGGQKRAKRLDVAGLLLACPFFKHDPAKYGKLRTCCGPGFVHVNRVK